MLLLSRIAGFLVGAGLAAFLEMLLISAIEGLSHVRVFGFVLVVLPVFAGIAGYRAAGALWQIHREVGVRAAVMNFTRTVPPLKRLVVAVSCFWMFSVAAYFMVFSPYGDSMSQEETAELFKVLLFPPFLLLVAALAARMLFFHEESRKAEESLPAHQGDKPKVLGTESEANERNSRDKVRRAIQSEVENFRRESSNLTASLSRGLVFAVVVFNAGLLGYVAFDRLGSDSQRSTPESPGLSSNSNGDSPAFAESDLEEIVDNVDSQKNGGQEDGRGNRHESSPAELGAYEHQRASFDCAKAKGFVEETVCSDAALAQMDMRMATRFHKEIKTAKDPGVVRSAQRRWLSEVRNQCSTKQCLMKAYSERLGEMSLDTASQGSDSDATTSGDFIERLLPEVRRPAGL